MVIQAKDDGSLGQNDGGRHGEKRSGDGYILKTEPTVGLNVGCEKKSIKDVSKDLILSNQRGGLP